MLIKRIIGSITLLLIFSPFAITWLIIVIARRMKLMEIQNNNKLYYISLVIIFYVSYFFKEYIIISNLNKYFYGIDAGITGFEGFFEDLLIPFVLITPFFFMLNKIFNVNFIKKHNAILFLIVYYCLNFAVWSLLLYMNIRY